MVTLNSFSFCNLCFFFSWKELYRQSQNSKDCKIFGEQCNELNLWNVTEIDLFLCCEISKSPTNLLVSYIKQKWAPRIHRLFTSNSLINESCSNHLSQNLVNCNHFWKGVTSKEWWALLINKCPWSFPMTNGARACPYPYLMSCSM